MEFFRRSLFGKFFIYVLIVLALLGSAMFGLDYFSIVQFRHPAVIAAGTAVFVIILLILYWRIVTSPMHAILTEMKALLAGKKFHRIYTKRIDELGVVSYFFNEVTKNIERISANLKEGERMSAELKIASDIQKMVLPVELPKVPGLDVYAATRAAVEIGGDNYDVIRSHNNTFLYVGDVTGHGVPAGLVMMMVNTLLDTFTEYYQSAYDVVVQVNRMLKPRIQSTMFMTMQMLRWHEIEKKIYAVGCGHEHIFIFHKNQNSCEVRQSGGIALGMIADNSRIIKEEVIPFEAGDFILLYSDGVIEAKNTSGEMFGLGRLKGLVEQFTPISHSSKELFTSLMAEFGKFVEDQAQNDDITLMVIRRTP